MVKIERMPASPSPKPESNPVTSNIHNQDQTDSAASNVLRRSHQGVKPSQGQAHVSSDNLRPTQAHEDIKIAYKSIVQRFLSYIKSKFGSSLDQKQFKIFQKNLQKLENKNKSDNDLPTNEMVDPKALDHYIIIVDERIAFCTKLLANTKNKNLKKELNVVINKLSDVYRKIETAYQTITQSKKISETEIFDHLAEKYFDQMSSEKAAAEITKKLDLSNNEEISFLAKKQLEDSIKEFDRTMQRTMDSEEDKKYFADLKIPVPMSTMPFTFENRSEAPFQPPPAPTIRTNPYQSMDKPGTKSYAHRSHNLLPENTHSRDDGEVEIRKKFAKEFSNPQKKSKIEQSNSSKSQISPKDKKSEEKFGTSANDNHPLKSDYVPHKPPIPKKSLPPAPTLKKVAKEVKSDKEKQVTEVDVGAINKEHKEFMKNIKEPKK